MPKCQLSERLVFLTMHDDANLAAAALELGSVGFVLKHSAGSELLTAIDHVLHGKSYVTPKLRHLRGRSSSGKTTLLRLAASVWGYYERYVRTWRATSSGLEGLATIHNDGLLPIDELSQVDPKEAGAAAYMLANGQGRARAARSGLARPVAAWRLLFLSAGEQSLQQLMAAAGRRPSAGQQLRMLEIEADAGAKIGVLEQLNGFENAKAMIASLREAAGKHYGAVGRRFLEELVADRSKQAEPNEATLADWLASEIRKFVAENTTATSGAQVERAARRFAVVAVAGELATKYRLTGWEFGEATRAAAACFKSWQEIFGSSGDREERQLLDQVRLFLEANGSSRFEAMGSDNEQRISSRCGFYRTMPSEDKSNTGGLREYLVLPQAFRHELLAEFDYKFAVRVLKEQQWLISGSDRDTQVHRLPGMGPTRVYVIGTRLWEDE
jgi:putative DNA primase/helicase